MSALEATMESPCQLLLLNHIWLSGGRCNISAMITSIVVIGKVSAENFLVSKEDNLMTGKSFAKRLRLLATFIPVFSLTALFRHGSGAVFIAYHGNVLWQPLNPIFSIFLAWLHAGVTTMVVPVVIYILRYWNSNIRKLEFVEIGLGVFGELVHIHITSNRFKNKRCIKIWFFSKPCLPKPHPSNSIMIKTTSFDGKGHWKDHLWRRK